MAFLLHPAMLVVLAGVVTYLVTGLVIRKAQALRLVQAPNARSSHARPTPSGGGIGIVCGTATIGLWAAWAGGAPLLAILAAAIALAMLGLADDLRDLPASLRLVIQAGVVAGLLLALRPLPQVDLAGFAIAPPLVAAVLLVAGLWWVNLFNFMDGIDGLAASEAVFVLLAGAVLCWHAAGQMPASPLWWWMIGGGARAIGFLAHNWPPARIFMGDVGSNHLAILIFGAGGGECGGGPARPLGLGHAGGALRQRRERDAAAPPGAPRAGVRRAPRACLSAARAPVGPPQRDAGLHGGQHRLGAADGVSWRRLSRARVAAVPDRLWAARVLCVAARGRASRSSDPLPCECGPGTQTVVYVRPAAQLPRRVAQHGVHGEGRGPAEQGLRRARVDLQIAVEPVDPVPLAEEVRRRGAAVLSGR